MAKRSPILGYNHNVRYRGIVFHVQTEDSGLMNPHVFSHLFHGGVILTTRKLVYDPDATEDVVKALMQAQHKAVLKDLRRGAFDDKIDVYLAGTPGLLSREAAVDLLAAEALPAIEAVALQAPELGMALEAVPELMSAETTVPSVELTGPPPIIHSPAPVEDIETDEPAIEIEAGPPDDGGSRTPTFQRLPPGFDVSTRPTPTTPPPIFGSELTAGFDSVTARTPPPAGVIDETDRVPVLPFPESLDALMLDTAQADPDRAALEPLMPDPQPSRRFEVDLDHVDLAAAHVEPMRAELAAGADRLEPFRVLDLGGERASTDDESEPELLELDPLPEPVRAEPPPVPPRSDANRSGPISAVRVSFVSARGPAPSLELPVVDQALLDAVAADRRAGYDVVSLDAIETPPTGVSTFEDLAPPLPPPPPLPPRPIPPGATPPRGVSALRSLPRSGVHDTVPRLAGVPAPTPMSAHGPPPIVVVPTPTQSPYAGSSAAMARPAGDTLQRLPPSAPSPGAESIEDDDLDAAGMGESSDIAEIHAPPLPSATNPPGVQPERPGQYHVTRHRTETPHVARPAMPTASRPVAPPRAPTPAMGRPVIPPPVSSPPPFRATPPASPALTRPGLPRQATRPPTNVPTARPDSSRPEPVMTPPSRPLTPRPTPRSRPATGAGVVVSRPAVIVGAPTRPTNSPVPPVRPRRARDTGTEGLITERSLDEVILAYLSEDGHEE